MRAVGGPQGDDFFVRSQPGQVSSSGADSMNTAPVWGSCVFGLNLMEGVRELM